jgi:hypothetical protein
MAGSSATHLVDDSWPYGLGASGITGTMAFLKVSLMTPAAEA